MIAYCLSGHTRGYESNPTNPSLDFINKEGIDLFISTWEFLGNGHLFWKGGVEQELPIDKKLLIQNYSPKILEVEKRSDYSDLFHFDVQFPSHQIVNVLNTLLMFKKIRRSFDMTNESHKVLIRSRFDLTHLDLEIQSIEPGIIYGRSSSMNGFTSDIFFYGDRETMKTSIPDETFYTEEVINTSMNAEHIFQKHLAHKGIKFIADQKLSFVLKNEIRY